MNHATFDYNGATFRVSEDTVGVGIDAETVLYLLFPEPTHRQVRHGLDYGRFLATVEVVSGDAGAALGAPLPTLDSPVEEIAAFYGVYERLPRVFRTEYVGAQARLIASANAPDLTPEFDPKKNSTDATDADATSSFNPSTETSTPSPALVSE